MTTYSNSATQKKQVKDQPLTVMVVPRSGKVLSFSIASSTVRKLAIALSLALLVSAAFAVRYNVMARQTAEFGTLKKVNAEQKEQIEGITTEIDTVKQDLQKIRELERKVRELLGGEREILNKRLSANVEAMLDPVQARQTISPVVSRTAIRDTRFGMPTLSDVGGIQQIVPGNPGSNDLNALQEEIRSVQASLEETYRALTATNANLETVIAEAKAMPSFFPVPGGQVTSAFGGRRSPFGQYVEFHEGVDIAAKLGTPVLAAGSGTISFSGYKAGLGLVVVIDHGNGITTTYGHLSKSYVSRGARIGRGDRIAAVGSSGRTTGPHLHLELRKDGRLQDPMIYLR